MPKRLYLSGLPEHLNTATNDSAGVTRLPMSFRANPKEEYVRQKLWQILQAQADEAEEAESDLRDLENLESAVEGLESGFLPFLGLAIKPVAKLIGREKERRLERRLERKLERELGSESATVEGATVEGIGRDLSEGIDRDLIDSDGYCIRLPK